MIVRVVEIVEERRGLVVERAGGFEQRVAIGLDIEAARIHAPQQLVGGIGGLAIGARMARLAIGRPKA